MRDSEAAERSLLNHPDFSTIHDEEVDLRMQDERRADWAKRLTSATLCCMGVLFYVTSGLQSLNPPGGVHKLAPPAVISEVLAVDPLPKKNFTLVGKSVYFLMVDRFARDHGGHDKRCRGDGWCGGTLKGVIRQLGYIQRMGFDCIWITPVIKQFEGIDPTNNCTGYHGYWAYKWYDIDPHFGSAEDLKALSEALHKRDMCLVYDMVVNHVGPLHSAAHVAEVDPFSKPEYFHQRKPTKLAGSKTVPRQRQQRNAVEHETVHRQRQQRSAEEHDKSSKSPREPWFFNHNDQHQHQAMARVMTDKVAATFDDYTECIRNQKAWQSCSTPLQANVGFGTHGNASKGAQCGVGMFDCPGYDEGVVNDGWLYDLGDLNQSVTFVRKELLRWAVHMVKTYKIDAIRLDTAPYVQTDFLAELQQSVDVEILGEVTTSNLTYHASFQQAKLGGKLKNILAGTINFPLFYTTKPAFCGPNLDLNGVASVMKAQLTDGRYARLDLLGNFVDNHDLPPRIGYSCKGEKTRVMNALAFTMFSRGVPIIYAGTEQGMAEKDDFRNSLWETGYRSDHELYNFMADMNRVRKAYNVSSVDAEVVVSSQTHLVFTRRGKWGVWIFLNNLNSTESGLVYWGAKLPPAPDGQSWANVLWSEKPARAETDGQTGDFVAYDTFPKVLVLVPDDVIESQGL